MFFYCYYPTIPIFQCFFLFALFSCKPEVFLRQNSNTSWCSLPEGSKIKGNLSSDSSMGTAPVGSTSSAKTRLSISSSLTWWITPDRCWEIEGKSQYDTNPLKVSTSYILTLEYYICDPHHQIRHTSQIQKFSF